MRIAPRFVRAEIPEGRSGAWTVAHFEHTGPRPAREDDPRPEWARCPPGRYTRLTVGKTVMMTDTREEWTTQLHAIARACAAGGDVLISGLGLGVVVDSMLATPDSKVEHITVIERASDVIALVAPHVTARWPERVTVVEADTFEWTPPRGARYSVGWHDIWPNPYDPRIRAEMDRLEDRYRHVCDWQASWGRGLGAGEADRPFAEPTLHRATDQHRH